MAVDDLESHYFELMMSEPGTSLDTFLERAIAGEFGAQDTDTLVAFLRRVERMILSSIQTRAAASPGAAEDAERLAEDQRLHIADLVARVRRQAG